MCPIYFGLALFVATSLTAIAQQNARDCAVAVATNYNKAKMALLENSLKGLSVETKIAERRLEEQYCLAYAKCEMQDISTTEQSYQMALGTAFSACLRDQAEEELNHASPRPKKRK